MGTWTTSVEAKANIIHSQMAAARSLAEANNGDIDAVSQPYLAMLNLLYQDEFAFAQLADSSDLVARFSGPSVDIYDPAVSVVISIFSDIREQIRGIAKAIVGLSTDQRVVWPATLDPHLSGIAHGSLIVGITVPPPGAITGKGQLEFDGVSTPIFESVRKAVQSLSVVARHIHENQVSESIREEFPDPAIRDTVMVAARRLAPTGRKGIDSVSFYSPESEEDREFASLTFASRIALSQALAKPVRVKGTGIFEGVVREIDLDAKRFEIRGVKGIGAIRCVYEGHLHSIVRSALDARVRVKGAFEALPSHKPRLVAVDSMNIIRPAEEQFALPE